MVPIKGIQILTVLRHFTSKFESPHFKHKINCRTKLCKICTGLYVLRIQKMYISMGVWPRRPKLDDQINKNRTAENKQPDSQTEQPNLTKWPKIEVL